MHKILTEAVFARALDDADAKLNGLPTADIPEIFKDIPLDVFALATCTDSDAYPNIASYFPKMPDEEFQRTWGGFSGETLLSQSTAFVKTVVSQFAKHTGRDISTARVLDYGVGWGRLLRLFNRFVQEDRLYGVDAWEPALNVAKAHGVRGHLDLVPSYPTQVPFQTRFDVAIAFSIFTHLSAKAGAAVSRTVANALTDDGIFAFTIRPISGFVPEDFPQLITDYRKSGIGFTRAPSIEADETGDISYGDTAMSLDYIRSNWPWLKVVDVEYNMIDAQQILVVTKRA